MKLAALFFFLFSALSIAQTNEAALESKTSYENDTVIVVESNSNKSFHHPYILYIPKGTKKNSLTTLLVEPNNTGFTSDSIEVHKMHALELAAKSSVGNNVSRMLNIPLLVPIFPRPSSLLLVYTHALDRDVMLQKETELERPDLQLVAMVADARAQLELLNVPTEEKIFMTGFSASGTFVNRFAFLQPGLIKALATGGLNAVLMLPLDKLGEQELNFPLGIKDLPKISGKDFDREEYLQIPQFIYMGQLDDNDAVKNDDAYSQQEREVIYTEIGENLQPERWSNFQKLYRENDVNAIFKTYEEVGHWTTAEMSLEIIKFFHTHR